MRKLYQLDFGTPFMLNQSILWYRKVDGMYAQVTENRKDLGNYKKWIFIACWQNCRPLSLLSMAGIYCD